MPFPCLGIVPGLFSDTPFTALSPSAEFINIHDDDTATIYPNFTLTDLQTFLSASVDVFLRQPVLTLPVGAVHHQVFIKGFSGCTHTVRANFDWTAEYFIFLLWRYAHGKFGHPGFFRLIYAGRQLYGQQSLRDFGLQSQSTVHLTGRFGDTIGSLARFLNNKIVKFNRAFLFRLWRNWFERFTLIRFWARVTNEPGSHAVKRAKYRHLGMSDVDPGQQDQELHLLQCHKIVEVERMRTWLGAHSKVH